MKQECDELDNYLSDKQRRVWIAAGMPTDLREIEGLLDHLENQERLKNE